MMMGLSVFLMVPVAALFSGLFLEDVAQAVEDRHYPGLAQVPHRGVYDSLIGSVNFFGVLLVANLLALLLYFFVGPFAPLLFWAVPISSVAAAIIWAPSPASSSSPCCSRSCLSCRCPKPAAR